MSPARTEPAPRRAQPRPELVSEGFPKRRQRWIEVATSADHKDVGRVLIAASLGFLLPALIELLMMRLQLAIPENSFLEPVTFNRMLSLYGATTIFLFALPLIIGFFQYIVPLQIGARGTALPRLGQVGLWLYVLGATVLYLSLWFVPPEGGTTSIAPLAEREYLPSNGTDVWAMTVGLCVLGFILLSVNLLATLRNLRAPGMAFRRMPVFAWAGSIVSWLMVLLGPVMLAAVTMLLIDRNGDGVFFEGEAGAPLLWQHMTWLFFTGVYFAITIFAFGAIAEIVSSLSRRPLLNRRVVVYSLIALAVIGTLAWIQNMFSAPIGIGWMYFGMLMALATIVPLGLIYYNLIGTMAGGALNMRAPLLFAAGALSVMSIGLTAELGHSLVASAWQLSGTTDSTAATHFTLIGGAVFAGFAALHYWFPKITGRTMGEYLARASFWTLLAGVLLTFVPLFLAGVEGQVVDAYKYFSGEGLSLLNLIATIGSFVLAIGVILTLVNAVLSLKGGPTTGHDPWNGESLEWFTVSPPPAHNFDVLPDVRSHSPLRDLRDAIARRSEREGSRAGNGRPVA
jgi:cytochrome c oxidase subunit 1